MHRGSAIVTVLLAFLALSPWVAPVVVLRAVGPNVLYGTGNWAGPDERGVYAVHPDGVRHSTRTRLMLSGSFAAFTVASLLWTIRRPRDDRSPPPPSHS